MRILRVADIRGDAPGGMHGYMTHSGRALIEMGHTVRYLFRGDLGVRPRGGGLRRLLVPWLIPLRVMMGQRRGARFDVVEIHEPLAAPYAFIAARARGLLPPCVVLSYGLAERLWCETKRYRRLTGERVPLKSRLLVPWTLLAPSRYGLRHAAHVVVPSSEDVAYLRVSWACRPTGYRQPRPASRRRSSASRDPRPPWRR